MEEPFGLENHSDGTPTLSVDAVCGKRIDESQAPARTECTGQIYCFCSARCQEQFEQPPQGSILHDRGPVRGRASTRISGTTLPHDRDSDRGVFETADGMFGLAA